MKKTLTLTAGLLLAWNACAADLLEVYREALAQDPQYAAAQAAYRAAQEKLPQGRAGLLPQATVSANTTYNDVDSSLSGSRQFNSNGYSVTASQPLFRKQNLVVYQQAKAQIEQAKALLAGATQDLALRVAQAYFDVLLAQDNVALAQAQRQAIAEQLAQAKRNFEVGTATIVDTKEAQARYDLISAQEIAAQNDLEIKRRALQQLIGRVPATLAPLREGLALSPPSPSAMEEWVALSETTNPSVLAQQAAYTLASQEVERTRAGHYPTLDLVASYSDAKAGSNFVANTFTVKSTTLGLQLAFPLYQGGLTQSQVREAIANQDRAAQNLEAARRGAALQTRQAYLGVTSGIAQVKALEQALRSSQSQLDSTRLGQEVGVRTQVDVLNAQQQLYSARRDLAQARYNYLLSELRLKAAAGTLSQQDLEKINQALQ